MSSEVIFDINLKTRHHRVSKLNIVILVPMKKNKLN